MRKVTKQIAAILLIAVPAVVGTVHGDESQKIEPLMIPWPNCGAGSYARLPCEADTKTTEQYIGGTVSEITEENIRGCPDCERKVVKKR